MKLTNKYGVHTIIQRAIENDSYDAGKSDISATSLIRPPQINRLLKEHGDKVSEDVADRGYSLLGQAVHSILERSVCDGDIAEKRYYAEVNGKTLSGQVDLISDGILTDFKVTSQYSVTRVEPKKEWVEQLNILDYLCKANGVDIERLEILAILRDWSRSKCKFDKSYPKSMFVSLVIPRWTTEEQEAFIISKMDEQFSDNVRKCTDEEMWRKEDTWAVVKPGRKSAIRVLRSEQDAENYRVNKALPGTEVVYRPGFRTRCIDYCPVAKFCPQNIDFLLGVEGK